MQRGTIVLSVLALVAGACGGGGSSPFEAGTSSTSASPVSSTQAPKVTKAPTTTAASNTATDITSAAASVVKIAMEGTYVDPQVGTMANVGGWGSGFIISPDGLVVTNNHVVTGAALLRVHMPGEAKPVNARILGVSECFDLAVVQLDGGDYPYLDFHEGDVAAGLDVFAAGYPGSDATTVEDADYTVTRGIVSSTEADGESTWSSVDRVLEHDARIRPGNSGGPLLDDQGRVVGINYAGIESSAQNYAIAAADSRDTIDALKSGQNVLSIGVNGEAVSDSAVNGIWVSSVASGSPADTAGIKPGDIITTIEGIDVATDGTMNDYCDVLRTHGADATLTVDVLRFDTSETLHGQINGTPLEVTSSFAGDFQGDVGQGTGDNSGAYSDFATVSDDSDQIFVDVPVEWSDTDGTYNDTFGPSIWAAPDLQAFATGWDTPGIKVEAATGLGAADIGSTLDEIDYSNVCTDGGRSDYDDGVYQGTTQFWDNCGDSGSSTIVLAAIPIDGGNFLVRVEILAVTTADLDAADRALGTFYANM